MKILILILISILAASVVQAATLQYNAVQDKRIIINSHEKKVCISLGMAAYDIQKNRILKKYQLNEFIESLSKNRKTPDSSNLTNSELELVATTIYNIVPKNKPPRILAKQIVRSCYLKVIRNNKNKIIL